MKEPKIIQGYYIFTESSKTVQMKRYIITTLFSIGIILLYQLVNVNLFTIDFHKRVSNSLFKSLGLNIPVDTTVVICNTGKLQMDEFVSKIDTLVKREPKIIGINICDFDKVDRSAVNQFEGNKRILISNCGENTRGQLSRLIEEGNVVTHFRSNRPDYFEVLLSDSWDVLKSRGNEFELIHYRSPIRNFFQFELKDIESLDKAFFQGKVVLVGYIDDYVSDEIYNYQSSRITPLNEYYGEDEILPDMYDIQISANILSTIQNKQFINEVNPLLRVVIILLFCLLNVGLLTLIQTRWLAVNLVLHTLIFITLLASGPFLMIYLFSRGYFLQLNELTILLIITSIFTVGSNIRDSKRNQQ